MKIVNDKIAIIKIKEYFPFLTVYLSGGVGIS
jgi:hypothetical protein